ncbi:MAG: FAD-dependent oxidoreductase, partial [Myxococcota bacterium]
LLAGPLADPTLPSGALDPLLARVQRRRMLPTRLTQAAQVAVQERVLRPVLAGGPLGLPWPLRLLRDVPALRAVPALLVGVGVRPEHVRSPVRT